MQRAGDYFVAMNQIWQKHAQKSMKNLKNTKTSKKLKFPNWLEWLKKWNYFTEHESYKRFQLKMAADTVRLSPKLFRFINEINILWIQMEIYI